MTFDGNMESFDEGIIVMAWHSLCGVTHTWSSQLREMMRFSTTNNDTPPRSSEVSRFDSIICLYHTPMFE